MTAEEARLAGLRRANAAREELRLERMALLQEYAARRRAEAPAIMREAIARDFTILHPQPQALGKSDGYAAAKVMLTELERLGFVPRRR